MAWYDDHADDGLWSRAAWANRSWFEASDCLLRLVMRRQETVELILAGHCLLGHSEMPMGS